MEFLIYFFKVIVFFFGFFILYEFLLKQETSFTANRIYLLSTSVLALVLPLVTFDLISTTVFSEFRHELPSITLFDKANQQPLTSSWSWLSVLWWTYVLISMVLLGLMLRKFFRLFRLIKTMPKTKQNHYTYVKIPTGQSAFSFLDFVFIPDQLSDHQSQAILKHELIHIRQKHTWDLLWFELLKVVLWFNPLVYLYQKRMTLLHEYIADNQTLLSIDKRHYINQLLNEKFETQHLVFINSFYQPSYLKKRIIMMTQNQTQSKNLLKYVTVLPLIVLILLLQNACKSDKVKQDKKAIIVETQTEKVNKHHNDVTVEFVELDKMPIFPGCSGTNEELKQCFVNEIQMYVNNHFNTDLAEILDLEAGTKQRISMMFTIDKTGHITDIKARAPHQVLEEEAIRVIKSLPQMTPGKQKGKPVNVKYALPIVFIIEA